MTEEVTRGRRQLCNEEFLNLQLLLSSFLGVKPTKMVWGATRGAFN